MRNSHIIDTQGRLPYTVGNVNWNSFSLACGCFVIITNQILLLALGRWFLITLIIILKFLIDCQLVFHSSSVFCVIVSCKTKFAVFLFSLRTPRSTTVKSWILQLQVYIHKVLFSSLCVSKVGCETFSTMPFFKSMLEYVIVSVFQITPSSLYKPTNNDYGSGHALFLFDWKLNYHWKKRKLHSSYIFTD